MANEHRSSRKKDPMTVHLTRTGTFLPGQPVDNDSMEERLGVVGDKRSRYRRAVLRNNGITSRHYALDEHGEQTHLNEELAALAVEEAVTGRGLGMSEIGMLAVGTTIPDILMPGFASMVHGRLGASGHAAPMEVLSTAGVCASGAAALQHAWSAVLTGRHERAVAAASELASAMMRGRRFAHESVAHGDREEVPEGFQYFNADFLRWMLSDGAGAAVLEREPNPDAPSLRVDWIELTSYAHELPVCMHLGTSDPTDVRVGKTWLSVADAAAAHEQGMLVVRQNTSLLADNIMRVAGEELRRLIKIGRIDPDVHYDWFLPHLSSMFFRDRLSDVLDEVGLDIPQDRWFTNLSTKGNTGSASMFIMLDEALKSGMFQRGDRILAGVPESGRFIMSVMQFTCV
jgi:3-oxoacyl-[acyl-carrier-protein] synthase III